MASDSEREQAVIRLREAVVEGRLTLEEFSDRVGSAQLARTTRDLALLTDDIPDPEPARRARPMPTVHRALFSHLVRRGPLELAPRSSFRSVFGTIDLDLRGATIPSPELELVIYNLFGTVTVLVPEGADVRVEGGGLFASQKLDIASAGLAPGAPRIRIRSSGLGGELRVRNRETSRLSVRVLRTLGR
jgi:hypothetical protein